MLEMLPEYLQKAGYDETAGRAATALRSYVSFHEKHGAVAPHQERIRSLLESLPVHPEDCSLAGATVLVQRDELMKQVGMPFGEFARCRHSIRQFAPEPVPDDQILRAVRIAQTSPSVCNRQGARVHIYSKQDKKDAILGIQKGSRGFGHLASHVVIITFDLRCLLDPGERHQAWVDGGLFAMSFLYAIHSLGLGACALQWGVAPEDDLALHAVAEIPEFEEVIMLAVVGSLPSSFAVAASVRKDIHEVGFVH
jgi:nitroreductase